MDGSPLSLYKPRSGLTPKKSPTTEKVQKRRLDIQRSERAAYWALFNTSVALLLYYDLCYIHCTDGILVHIEWIVCAVFTLSACWDFTIHFWPYTFMEPIVITPTEKGLLGVQEDEFGFKVGEESPPVKFEPVFNPPPYEIHYSFQEDEKDNKPRGQYSPSVPTRDNYETDEYISCPYSSEHKLRRSRLLYHLMNCQNNPSAPKFSSSPFNFTQRVRAEDQSDILLCEDSRNLNTSSFGHLNTSSFE